MVNKNALIKLIFLLLAINGFSQSLNIDKVLERAGTDIGNSLENDTTIAILNFSTFSEELSNYIINGLTTSILKTGNLRIVSRQRISQILSELDFQMSGYVSDETAQSIGKMIGAQTVISGSITRINNEYRLNIQCLEVKTAIVQKSMDFDIQRNSKMKSFESSEPERSPKKKNLNPDSINLFENYNPFTTFSMLGFTYVTADTPVGFTIGGFGFYASCNFAIPNWQGYEHDTYYKYDGDGKINVGYSSEYTRYIDRNIRTYQMIDWTVGYNFNIIPKFLFVPIGFGVRMTKEWRLFDEQSRNYNNIWKTDSTEWYGPAHWGTGFLFEAGLLLKIKFIYLSGTYRTNNSFSLGLGICEGFGKF